MNEMTEHSQGFRDFMSVSPYDDGKARAGSTLAEGVAVANSDAVTDALRRIYDPEIPVNIYDLGLIYDMELDERGNVAIDMTLTAPACPVAGEMPQWVADEVAAVEGVGEVTVAMVWDPPWSPARMSEDARMILDIG